MYSGRSAVSNAAVGTVSRLLLPNRTGSLPLIM
jgi:hypothetical protein